MLGGAAEDSLAGAHLLATAHPTELSHLTSLSRNLESETKTAGPQGCPARRLGYTLVSPVAAGCMFWGHLGLSVREGSRLTASITVQ